jgi:hypothetical protein
MKNRLLPLFEVGVAINLIIYSVVAAYTAGSGIRNSPHDLSTGSTYYSASRYNPERETNVCIFCHVPFESVNTSGITGEPQWTHAPSAIIRFAIYSSGSEKLTDPNHRLSAGVSRGPGPISKLCLGCHDGSVAVNRYGSLAGNSYISDSYKIGRNGDLSNHHPIGFIYAAVVDDEINMFASLAGQPVEALLRDGRMECVTCHDVHNSQNTGERLLWITDRKSGLCCTCHRKCSK